MAYNNLPYTITAYDFTAYKNSAYDIRPYDFMTYVLQPVENSLVNLLQIALPITGYNRLLD